LTLSRQLQLFLLRVEVFQPHPEFRQERLARGLHNTKAGAMTQREMNGVNGLRDGLESTHIHTNGTNGTTNTKGNGVKEAQRYKMDRKKSSPMMPAFMVSAPGKVIVCGEHAVVHGKVRLVSRWPRRAPSSLGHGCG